MTLDQLSRIAAAIATVLNAGCAIYVYLARRSLASRNEVSALHLRVSSLEQKSAAAPDWDAIDKVKQKIAEMDGDLKALKVSVGSVDEKAAKIDRAVERIEDHLLGERERRI